MTAGSPDALDLAAIEEMIYALTTEAAQGPLESDISDWSDEWCAGYVAGQTNGLQVLHRRLDYREWQRAAEAPTVYSGAQVRSEAAEGCQWCGGNGQLETYTASGEVDEATECICILAFELRAVLRAVPDGEALRAQVARLRAEPTEAEIEAAAIALGGGDEDVRPTMRKAAERALAAARAVRAGEETNERAAK